MRSAAAAAAAAVARAHQWFPERCPDPNENDKSLSRIRMLGKKTLEKNALADGLTRW